MGLLTRKKIDNCLGEHWLAIWLPPARKKDKNGQNSEAVEFFDSYSLGYEFYATEKAWLDWIMRLGYSKIIQNTNVLQQMTTDVCAEHCIFYIYFRCLSISLKNIQKNLYHGTNLSGNDIMVYDFVHVYCMGKIQHNYLKIAYIKKYNNCSHTCDTQKNFYKKIDRNGRRD